MDVNTIRDLVYDSTGTTSNQIPTTSILSWMNIAYHDIVETIKHEVDPDFFYRFFTTNIVAGQNEYALRLGDNDDVGMDKVSQVGVKYSTTATMFTELDYKDAGNLDHMPEWYESNQSTSNPFYLVRDNSIFIYPTPSTNVTDGLRVHAIYTPIDLVAGGAESTIKFARQYHEGIALGARRYVYAKRSMPKMETDSINKFNEFKQYMVKSLRRRIAQPLTKRNPNLVPTFN